MPSLTWICSDKPMKVDIMFDIGGWIKQAMRVMNVATLPREKEFNRIIKITGIGMIAVGLIGVILSFVVNLV